MPEERRRTEGEMMAEFHRLWPRLLGALYSAVAAALQNSAIIGAPKGIRMADAAKWIAAAEPALPVENGALLKAIPAAQNELFIERINEEPLVMALRVLFAKQPFEGYVGELFVRLHQEDHDRTLPKTAMHLSNQLASLRPAMARAGVLVEFPTRDKRGRKVRIWTPEPFDLPSRSPEY